MVYKSIFPIFWIGLFGLGTIALFSKDDPAKWISLAALTVGTLFLTWSCLPLKRVTIEGSDLLVSNFLRTIRVPLDQICGVKENVLINIHPVWIHFRGPTNFGSQIVFMPTIRMFSLFGSHPIVAELMALARQEQSGIETDHQEEQPPTTST